MIERVSAEQVGETDPFVGRVIHQRFKLIERIARGGMGKLYRAEQLSLGRICAIKLFSPKEEMAAHSALLRGRFGREARLMSNLTHPNNVTIFEYGQTEDDLDYIAMEYLKGRTLQRMMRAQEPLSEERVRSIAYQIGQALHEVHTLDGVHCDLKPANVFVLEHEYLSDFVKLFDFGLVKQVKDQEETSKETEFLMGSIPYMAPEQIRNESVDARTDMYSLGVVMYEMLTGQVPFPRSNNMAVRMAQLGQEPIPLGQSNPQLQISDVLEQTVMRAIAMNPKDRFSSMGEMMDAIKPNKPELQRDEPVRTEKPLASSLTSGDCVRTDTGSKKEDRRDLPAKQGGKQGGLLLAFIAGVVVSVGILVAIDPTLLDRWMAFSRKGKTHPSDSSHEGASVPEAGQGSDCNATELGICYEDSSL